MTRLISILTLMCAAALTSANAQDQAPHRPTSAELSRDETPAKAFMRTLEFQEYEVRSAAEAMPEDKWDFRPANGMFKNEKPEFGPGEVRTFREQVKHVACANFAFAAELDGTTPPMGCDKDGPSPAHTRSEILTYLRDSYTALDKSISAITVKNMYDPMAGPYATPNTRLGLAGICLWHNADHYGQMVMYLRLNGIVPPGSRNPPPKLQEKY
jgi:hypothetical protein